MVLSILLELAVAGSASTHLCPVPSSTGPSAPSESRTLNGKLVYHDGIRQWFELKMVRPQCGTNSIEIVGPDYIWKTIEPLRGCSVRAVGKINFSETGYYSRDLYDWITSLKPVGTCQRKPPIARAIGARPDPSVRQYRVRMYIDYRPGDNPIIFNIRSGRKALHPWQAYASYMLTGGFVLYGHCGKNFVVDTVSGTPAARPAHFAEPRTSDDMAEFDPESAAQAGTKQLALSYTCVRQR